MIKRPTKHEWAMELARVTSLRSTCLRRQVGAVLVNKRGHVLATGYNGVAAGLPHCNEEVLTGVFNTPNGKPTGVGVETPIRMAMRTPNACAGAHAPSGTMLDACGAIHAEQNALLQCGDVYAIQAIYVTASPCVTCTKLLLNTSCEVVIYQLEYSHNLMAEEMWRQAGRVWCAVAETHRLT